MLSVFSKLGSQWVSKQTGALEFESMASALASQIVTWLKLTQRIPEERAAEPDRDTALELSSGEFSFLFVNDRFLQEHITLKSHLRQHISKMMSSPLASYINLLSNVDCGNSLMGVIRILLILVGTHFVIRYTRVGKERYSKMLVQRTSMKFTRAPFPILQTHWRCTPR